MTPSPPMFIQAFIISHLDYINCLLNSHPLSLISFQSICTVFFIIVLPKLKGIHFTLSLKHISSSFLGLCCIVQLLNCVRLCDFMDCSTPGFPVPDYLPEFAQIHVRWVSDAIQPSHPLSPLSPLALNLSQYQGLFQWLSSLHQVAKILKL